MCLTSELPSKLPPVEGACAVRACFPCSQSPSWVASTLQGRALAEPGVRLVSRGRQAPRDPRLGTVGEEPQHGFGVAGPPEVGPCKTEVLTIHHCERIVQTHMDYHFCVPAWLENRCGLSYAELAGLSLGIDFHRETPQRFHSCMTVAEEVTHSPQNALLTLRSTSEQARAVS